jgi:alkylated DNA repair dioxygenase AlkB
VPTASSEKPQGLVYEPDFLGAGEERALLHELERLDYREISMRGQTARRSTRHFGYDYDYHGASVAPGDALPAWLLPLRSRSGELAGVEPAELVEALITRYPAGAGIGWHRDAPKFGPEVIGVSLLSACRMRFQRGKGDQRGVFDLELAPRSAYVLSGESREEWQHSIPPTEELRYSITFRALSPGLVL